MVSGVIKLLHFQLYTKLRLMKQTLDKAIKSH
jgi:hypothetical protein